LAFVDLSGYRTRLEILYHSIHYFDLIRSWLGNPQGIYGKDPPHGEPRGHKDHRHPRLRKLQARLRVHESQPGI